MNYWLLAAGIAALATFGIHVFMGGPAIEGPMLASALDPALKSVWSVVWHMVSAVLLLSAIAFSWAAARPAVSLQIATFPLAASVSFIGIFLFYGVLRHQSVTVMPQWILFLVISVLAGIGLTRRNKVEDRGQGPELHR